MKSVNNTYLYFTEDIAGPCIKKVCRYDGLFEYIHDEDDPYYIEYIDGDNRSISFIHKKGKIINQRELALYPEWTIEKIEKNVEDGTWRYYENGE